MWKLGLLRSVQALTMAHIQGDGFLQYQLMPLGKLKLNQFSPLSFDKKTI